METKQHAKSCGTNKHKYHGDVRNQSWGNEMHPCNCDGYHTFDELYDHRITLWIALCKKLSEEFVDVNPVWRTKVHSDGSSWDGWFVLGAFQDNNSQITYHIPISRWDETEFAITLEKAPEFDGHTSEDVLKRIKSL